MIAVSNAKGGSGRMDAESETLIAGTLQSSMGRCQVDSQYVTHALRADGFDASEDGTERTPAVKFGMQVRRLTPTECERLQGFTDDYTAVPYRGKPAADGPRYRALGNSMAVPVMAWLGKRIQLVDSIGLE